MAKRHGVNQYMLVVRIAIGRLFTCQFTRPEASLSISKVESCVTEAAIQHRDPSIAVRKPSGCV